jgi:hypothetical protein
MQISKSFSSIAVTVVVLLVLASVVFITPLSAGAGNATKTAAVTTHTTRVGNASTAAA